MKKFQEYLEEIAVPYGSPNSGMVQPNVNRMQDLQVKRLLKTRLSQVFRELDGYNLPRQNKIELLDIVLGELGMKDADIMTAFRQHRRMQ